jgi:UDPglucose--hexose-1-phosphate uridylyltransferase
MLWDDLKKTPHRRFNPLTGDWVLVSPHRTQRPWQGQVESRDAERSPSYDPSCYLCPGNTRAGGHRNPPYESTFVFENDYAAMRPAVGESAIDVEQRGLIVAQTEPGVCRVLCFSPQHNLTVPRMTVAQIRTVIDLWGAQYAELGAHDDIRYVQIFENRGAMMGASNPHPHCQIWANRTIPNGPAKESLHFQEFRARAGKCLLCDYLELELKDHSRIVCENDRFVALVPFWAVWPFETMVLSRRHVQDIPGLSSAERDDLASILKRLTARYDNLFQTAFPYSMGFHQRPTDGQAHDEWHFHAHYYPPLLRSATIRKFMVGYELLCAPQRDLTPEAAADQLRSLSESPLAD